jgi:hypothetical protein
VRDSVFLFIFGGFLFLDCTMGAGASFFLRVQKCNFRGEGSLIHWSSSRICNCLYPFIKFPLYAISTSYVNLRFSFMSICEKTKEQLVVINVHLQQICEHAVLTLEHPSLIHCQQIDLLGSSVNKIRLHTACSSLIHCLFPTNRTFYIVFKYMVFELCTK